MPETTHPKWGVLSSLPWTHGARYIVKLNASDYEELCVLNVAASELRFEPISKRFGHDVLDIVVARDERNTDMMLFGPIGPAPKPEPESNQFEEFSGFVGSHMAQFTFIETRSSQKITYAKLKIREVDHIDANSPADIIIGGFVRWFRRNNHTVELRNVSGAETTGNDVSSVTITRCAGCANRAIDCKLVERFITELVGSKAHAKSKLKAYSVNYTV